MAILNQPWEDVADDVTGAIEKAVQPLLKKAVDDIYGGLLNATQDYLRDNLAFNIASRINAAERQALSDRQELAREKEKATALIEALEALQRHVIRNACTWVDAESGSHHHPVWQQVAEALSLAKGETIPAEAS